MAKGEGAGWATATVRLLEALSGGEAALWRYEIHTGELEVTGDIARLGLKLLAPRARIEALIALVRGPDRDAALTFFGPDGEARRSGRFKLDGGPNLVWRGVWLEGEDAASGLVYAAASEGESRDELTGLLDRNSFIHRVEQRLAEPGALRLVAADLARLRRLNEGLGPDRADIILRALGARLAAHVPEAASPARIGEDEFAFLLDESQADQIPAIRAALERPLSVRGMEIHPSLWIGSALAEGGPDHPDAHDFLRRASLSLQSAKRAGKIASAAKPVTGDGMVRLSLEGDLRGSIARGEITPFYQPVAYLATRELAGFEALARWKHPRRGLIMPDNFIPLLADAGQMGEFGRYMLQTAAAQLAQWRRAHPAAGDFFIAVNLSTVDLEDPGLPEFVANIVHRFELPPRALKIEITESDIMRDPEQAAAALIALRDAGAGLSLDDFGTGFSSLAYLTRLPFETLKIDRYFVSTMDENEGSEKIVRSIASLGRDLGLEIVAEGVETVAAAEKLSALGCHYGQGFGYAKALEAQEAEVYLNESYLDGAPLKRTA